jgi:hypothetical protein
MASAIASAVVDLKVKPIGFSSLIWTVEGAGRVVPWPEVRGARLRRI